MPGPDDRDALRSMHEPDARPSRLLVDNLIHECGNITHLPIVCWRCGPAIVNLADVIGNLFGGSRLAVFAWVPERKSTWCRAHRGRDSTGKHQTGYVIGRSPPAIAVTRDPVNMSYTHGAVRTRDLR